MTYEQFLADPRTQDAVVRNFGIIGEAVKNLRALHRRMCTRKSLECEQPSFPVPQTSACLNTDPPPNRE